VDKSEAYPIFREKIKNELEVMPEMIRYINPPTALNTTYFQELMINMQFYMSLLSFSDEKLTDLVNQLCTLEKTIDEQYEIAKLDLRGYETEFCGGLEICGLYYKEAFTNIMRNLLDDEFSVL